MRSRLVLLWMGLLLAGCQTAPRRAAPPELIGTATPPGFPPSVRLVTTDQRTFSALAPDFFGGIRSAAIDGTVDILALSGGGSGGAYGAGVLAGMTRAHARPQFEMVTGVSAGALLAPFAFLGPDWDARMQEAFTNAKRFHVFSRTKEQQVEVELFRGNAVSPPAAPPPLQSIAKSTLIGGEGEIPSPPPAPPSAPSTPC